MRSISVPRGDVELRADLGERCGPPVLFIQGVGVAGQGWSPQWDALQGQIHGARFDHRGIGASPRGEQRLTFDLLVDDAIATMDAAGFPSAHVVGHSMGGLVALGLALRHPERVRSLSLWCTFAAGSVPTRFDWRILWTGLRSAVGTRRSRRHAFLGMVLADAERHAHDLDVLAEQVSTAFGADIGDRPPVALQQLRAIAAVNVLPELGALGEIPTWIVSAEHDILAPPQAGRAIHAAIPGSRYDLIEGAAHGAPITRTEWMNAALLAFIVDAEGRRSQS